MMDFRGQWLRKLRADGTWGFAEGGFSGWLAVPRMPATLYWIFGSKRISLELYFWLAGKRHSWEFFRGANWHDR